MLVNDLIIDAISGSYPNQIKQNILNPSKHNVFSTLFFLMYNGVLRELVNKFYCIFIAADIDMSSIEIEHLFEVHKSQKYFSIYKQRFVSPLIVDISAVYHIYTPFNCQQDDVEPNETCLDFGPPTVQIVQSPQDSKYVNESGIIYVKVVVTSNTFDGSVIPYDYTIDGAEITDHDKTTGEMSIVPHSGADLVKLTIRSKPNCRGSGYAIKSWQVKKNENNINGLRIICEGDPPYTNTSIPINNDFASSENCTISHYVGRCEGEQWEKLSPNFNAMGEPIDGGFVPPPFISAQDMGDGNLLLKPDVDFFPLCSDFDRFQVKTVRQCQNSTTTNYFPLDNMPFHPYIWFMKKTLTTQGFIGQDITVLPPIPLQPNQQSDYWLHTKKYHNEFPLYDYEFKPTHGETWDVYLSSTAIEGNDTWPVFIFGLPKEPFRNICDMNNIVPIVDYIPGATTFSDLKIYVKKIDNYSIFNTFENVIKVNTSNEIEAVYQNEYSTYRFDLDLPDEYSPTVQYRLRFDFNCIRYYVNLLLHWTPPRRLTVVPTLNSPNSNDRRYDLHVYQGDRDVSDEYTFTIQSDLDGDVTPDTEGTVSGALFELLTSGVHQVTFTANPKLPYYESPTFTLQDTVEKPSFNICVPDTIGNLIDSFRDEYLSSPCLPESDQFRVDAGMEAYKWSDHLAYAALRHAYYLEQNGGRLHPSGNHYELPGTQGFFGETIGKRVTASNYNFISCGEGISNEPDFCSHYNLFKNEYTGDPYTAGHFGAWVKPPPPDGYYVRDIGYARYGGWTVTVYGTARSLAGQVPEIPAEINTGMPISTESSYYRSDSYFLQTCLQTTVDTDPAHPVVTWMSDIDGNITEAVSISESTTRLSPGTHTITAYFYYNGQKLSDSTTITILPPCELISASEVTPSIARLQFEQCTIGINQYRVNNGFGALELNDYLIQECQRHAYYCHIHNRDYSGSEDISLTFNGGHTDPRERAKLLGYKSFSYHFAVIPSTNYCDAWYMIENGLTEGQPPLHHYDSDLYRDVGIGSYGNYTCIAMGKLNTYTKPLVPISIPYQSSIQPHNTYVFGYTDPVTGSALNIVWSSDIQGELGISPTLEAGDNNVQLIPGEHVITATAETSCGETSTSFPVTIFLAPELSLTLAGGLNSYLFTVSDLNSLADTSTAIWSSSIQGVLDSGFLLRDETETIVLQPGTHTITVSVLYNGVTYTASGDMTYTISPPTIDINIIDNGDGSYTFSSWESNNNQSHYDLTGGTWSITSVGNIGTGISLTTTVGLIGSQSYRYEKNIDSVLYFKEKTFDFGSPPLPVLTIGTSGGVSGRDFTVNDSNSLVDYDAVVWVSDLVSGPLASGRSLNPDTSLKRLVAGTHTFTASVDYLGVTYTVSHTETLVDQLHVIRTHTKYLIQRISDGLYLGLGSSSAHGFEQVMQTTPFECYLTKNTGTTDFDPSLSERVKISPTANPVTTKLILLKDGVKHFFNTTYYNHAGWDWHLADGGANYSFGQIREARYTINTSLYSLSGVYGYPNDLVLIDVP